MVEGETIKIMEIYLRQELSEKMVLNERQIKTVIYVKENGRITNKEYQEVCDTSGKTATQNLSELVSKGIFEQIGTTGKGDSYILRRRKEVNEDTMMPQGVQKRDKRRYK